MIKRGMIVFLGIGLFATARGADTGVEFSGVLTTDGKTKLALTDKATGVTRWVDPGAEINGFQVARYDASDEIVILHRAGQDFRLPLVAPKEEEPAAPAAPQVTPTGRATPSAGASRVQPPPSSPPPAPPPAPVLAPEPPTAAAPAPPPAPARTAQGTAAAEGMRTRTVQAGDTLESIAKAAGLTPQQLQSLNPNVNGGSLQVGQVVRIR